ncbi:TatD family hydrolase [Vibrio sp.]|nr:TatD family hydrolase [Vibrio sp.]
MIDTHCHFDFDVFNQSFEKELQYAQNVGVEKIVVPSIGPQNWDRVYSLATQYAGQVYGAFGIHPYFLENITDSDLDSLSSWLDQYRKHCVAIGECGLDAMVETPYERQLDIFSTQIELAVKHQLPVIVHSRKMHSQVAKVLRQFPNLIGGVVHGFSGSYQQAMELVDLGMKIGVGGTITYLRANKTRQCISQLPLECLVLETDAPDMPLYGRQGKPNHPKYLPEVLVALQNLRSEEPEIVAQALWRNSVDLFQFSVK